LIRLSIISPGRFGEGPEKALYEHFAARFAPVGRSASLGPLRLVEVTARKGMSEHEAVMAAVPPGARLIALDPRGAAASSEDFARRLAGLRDQGAAELAFLIGGADGLGPARDKADFSLSFGAATWPHLLVRGMLAEQLYRCATILVNHPYHRGG